MHNIAVLLDSDAKKGAAKRRKNQQEREAEQIADREKKLELKNR